MDAIVEKRMEKRQTWSGAIPSAKVLPSANVQSPPPALIPTRPSTSHRNSSLSLNKMPRILEDEDAMFSNSQRRSRVTSVGPFYRYGEDYITPWELVGVVQSPPPRAQSRQSTFSSRATNSGDLPDLEAGEDEKLAPVRKEAWVAGPGGWRRLVTLLLLVVASAVGLGVGLKFGIHST